MANQFMDSASNCALTRSFPVKITSERLGRLIQFVLTASMQWSGGKALIWFKVFLIVFTCSFPFMYYLKTIVFECIFRY